MKRLLLLFSLIILLSCSNNTPLSGDTTHSENFIKGKVIFENSNDFVNAKAILYKQKETVLAKQLVADSLLTAVDTTTFNNDGSFSFIITSHGIYTIKALVANKLFIIQEDIIVDTDTDINIAPKSFPLTNTSFDVDSSAYVLDTIFLNIPLSSISYTTGSIVDVRDSTSYRTIKINNMEWMSEDLLINSINSIDFDTSTDVYGSMHTYYSWSGALNVEETYNTVYCDGFDDMGICPEGFRVPSLEDWDTLASYIDAASVKQGIQPNGKWLHVAEYLKTREYWGDDISGSYVDNPNKRENGVNTFAMSFIPQQILTSGDSQYARFMSSTQNPNNPNEFITVQASSQSDDLLRVSVDKSVKIPVRCVKDL